jgi:hypothetical protein
LSPISETEFVYMDGGVELTFIKGDDDRYDQIQRWGAVLSRTKGQANGLTARRPTQGV